MGEFHNSNLFRFSLSLAVKYPSTINNSKSGKIGGFDLGNFRTIALHLIAISNVGDLEKCLWFSNARYKKKAKLFNLNELCFYS